MISLTISTAILLQQLQVSNEDASEPSPVRTAYTMHASIHIDGDSGFLGSNASTGISRGSGTASDPYIIEGWEISSSTLNGIQIDNANAYFIIRNCYIHVGWSSYNSGIYLYSSGNGTIMENVLSNNYYGIYLLSSSNNSVVNNNCSQNWGFGAYFEDSSDNSFLDNLCCSNGFSGVYLDYPSNRNDLVNNTCCTNNWNGIWLTTSTGNNLIANNCSYNSNCGIYLYYPSDSNIANNTCSGNDYGIYLEGCSNNTIMNNTCRSNIWYGLVLDGASNNTLTNNACSDNLLGIYLEDSSSFNTIAHNSICNNTLHGIYSSSSNRNTFFNNNFWYNNGATDTYASDHAQAYDSGTGNRWNSTDGYGNFWCDWTTPDDDINGIVDRPYNISGSAGAKDWYPLTSFPYIPEFASAGAFALTTVLVAVLAIAIRRSRRA
ncbi:MAG: NosD domain-containing protein [Thermoplasmata archaeon]